MGEPFKRGQIWPNFKIVAVIKPLKLIKTE